MHTQVTVYTKVKSFFQHKFLVWRLHLQLNFLAHSCSAMIAQVYFATICEFSFPLYVALMHQQQYGAISGLLACVQLG